MKVFNKVSFSKKSFLIWLAFTTSCKSTLSNRCWQLNRDLLDGKTRQKSSSFLAAKSQLLDAEIGTSEWREGKGNGHSEANLNLIFDFDSKTF